MYTNNATTFTTIIRICGLLGVVLCGFLVLGAPKSAEAAITLVATSSATSSSAQSVTPAIPTGTSAGDVMVAYCHAYRNTTADTWDDNGGGGRGWTQLFSIKQVGNRDRENAVYYKLATTSSDGAPTFTIGGANQPVSCAVSTYRGVDQNNIFDVAYVQGSHYYQGTNSLNPNPPAITTVTDGAWVLQFMSMSENTNHITAAGAPSGYTLLSAALPGSAHVDNVIVTAYKQVSTAGTEDAGVWTHTAGVTNTQDHAGVVLALRPSLPFSISGRLYNDAGMTTAAGVKSVKLAIGTGTVSVYETSTDSSGQFIFSVAGIASIPTSTPVLLWVDNETYFKATRFTKASSTNATSITGADLYQEHFIVTTETNYLDTGETVSITDLSFYDKSDDSDIGYLAATTSAGLRVSPVTELYVLPKKVLVGEYPITVLGSASASSSDGTVRLDDGAFVFQVATTTIGGNFRASTTAAWVALLGGIEFNATTSGKTISGGALLKGLGRVHFSGVGGGWTFVDDAIVEDITITTGTVTVAAILGVGGDFTNRGTFINTDGLLVFIGPGVVTGIATGTSALGTVGIDQSTNQLWTQQDSAVNDVWTSVTYGEGLFVAVSYLGRVMVSQNGKDWSEQDAPEANQWLSVTYGNGRFVAVADSGSSRVMYSDDGLNWVAASSSAQNSWISVTYGEGLYVAVSYDGANRVMTSANGSSWTTRTAAYDSAWYDVTYGNGRFVAVALFATEGVAEQVMYSDNGTAWSTATASDAFFWSAVTYGEGVYVAVAISGTDTVMSSTDGVTWTTRDIPTDGLELHAVEYGNGYFIALASSSPLVLYSQDGENWVDAAVGLPATSWSDMAYGDGRFVAVASDPVYQVMTSEFASELLIATPASTTNLTVALSSTLRAPDKLSVTGDFTNTGVFSASGTGEIILSGVDQLLSSEGTTTFHHLTKRASGVSTLAFAEGKGYEVTGTLTLSGTPSNGRLLLRSTTPGVAWNLLPKGPTTLQYLDVQDSFNASSTLLSCSIGCFDSGNNTQWLFIYAPLASVLAGTAYVDGGTTSAAPGATVIAVIATTTTSVYATTTRAGGAYTIGGFSDGYLLPSTPMLLFYDASSTDALTLFTGYAGTTSAATIPMHGNRVLAYGASSTSNISVSDFTFYDRDNDSDILMVTATSASSTTFFQDLVIQQGTFRASPTSTVIIGSLTNNSTFDDMGGTVRLAGTSEVVTGTLTDTSDLGDVRVSGSYSVTSALASTTDLIIESGGSLTAPATRLSVAGNFVNSGTFNDNGGELVFAVNGAGPSQWGRDSGGTATGTGAVIVQRIVVAGDYAYVAKRGSTGTCNNTTGTGCELMVFDISVPFSPRYVAGRDSAGGTGTTYNTTFFDLFIQGTYLYAAKNFNNNTACSQTVGTNGSDSCELMVFDISSSTNPVYVAGRDSDGTAAGTTGWELVALAATGTTLYVGKYTDSTTGYDCIDGGTSNGCALMVFNIASATNPTLVAKRAATGVSGGTGYEAIISLEIVNNILYAGLNTSYTDACSQTAGSIGAEECELQVYDISSTTNPVFRAGRDASGANSGGTVRDDIVALEYANGYLYAVKWTGNSTPCSQSAGSAAGCELMVYDVSSSTNPRYVAGRDASGSSAGTSANYLRSLAIVGSTLYVGSKGDATSCAQVAGAAAGCELQVYDLSSSTNPQLMAVADAGFGSGGTGAVDTNHILPIEGGVYLLLARDGNATACSLVAGSAVGCEIVTVYPVTLGSSGAVSGTLTGTSDLGNLRIQQGSVSIVDNASTTDFVLASSTSVALPTFFTVADDFTNSGTVTPLASTTLVVSGDYINNGVIAYQSSGVVSFDGASAQAISGTLTGTSSLPATRFSGAGTKTVSSIASTTEVTIANGATVNAPTHLSVASAVNNGGTLVGPSTQFTVGGSLTNTGTYTASGGTLDVTGLLGLLRGGRDVSGSATGTANVAINQAILYGEYLYIAKAGNGTACSQSIGSAAGCELMVFDVSSSTNPVYRAGRDANGLTNGSLNQAITAFAIHGDYLYAVKPQDRPGWPSSITCPGSGGGVDAQYCELAVFDIASRTNPIYAAGRDSDGGTGDAGEFVGTPSISVTAVAATGTTLYLGKAGATGACSQAVGSADGCELMVFNISSGASPTYVAGRDANGAAAGNTTNDTQWLEVYNNALYVGRAGGTTGCSQSSGTNGARDCEVQVYHIGSTTDPVYVAGRDADGSTGGTASVAISEFITRNNYLYVGKSGSAGTCNDTTGTGCELMVFNAASTTNPVYVAGRDASGVSGGAANIRVSSLAAASPFLYVTKEASASACASGTYTGCELMVFTISSSSNPTVVAGISAAGSSDTESIAAFSVAVDDESVYIAKGGDATACSGVAGSALGCELLVFDAQVPVSGTLTGISALGHVTVSGNARFQNNASTTNLTVTGNLIAPSHLSVEGNYTQSGAFSAASGTVYLSGATQQTATGTMVSGSAFHNLTIKNVSGNGTTSQAVVFGAPLETTGTFAMAPSSSARFLANATSTFEAVNWTGTANSPVWLRSSATGTQWRFTTDDFVSTSYVNVRDSYNASSTLVPCTTGCVDVGNNTNWSFASSAPASAGTLTLGSHPSGQANNLFSHMNQDDGLLYRFSLTAATETAIVDDVVLSLFGLRGVDTSEVTDLRLYRDVNSDGALDGGDTQVLGAGIMAIDGETGTITFSTGTTSVATTSAQRYIVTADTVAIDTNDWMNVQLRTTGITATGFTSLLPTTVDGTVTSIQHIRGGQGGGVSRTPVGGDAPAGAGTQTGGGQGGGQSSTEAGQGTDGANIAPDPDFFRPTQTGDVFDEWTDPALAYQSDGDAAQGTAGKRQTYGGFGFAIPSSNTIQGIQVKLDGSGTTAAGTIQVGLSWDGGSSVTTLESTPTLSGSDVVYTLGGQSNLWGRSWTPAEFNNANFRVRVVGNSDNNIVLLDAIEVRVYHTAGGGGGGGGGGAI